MFSLLTRVLKSRWAKLGCIRRENQCEPPPYPQAQTTRRGSSSRGQELGFEDTAVWAQMPACQVLEKATLNSSLGFCEPSFPALAGLLSRLNRLTFSKHSVNVIMSEGLLINFYPEMELLSS